jgi:hypothetical protein
MSSVIWANANGRCGFGRRNGSDGAGGHRMGRLEAVIMELVGGSDDDAILTTLAGAD